MWPKAVGLPGLTAMPWNATDPFWRMTSSVRSRSPTELPPEKTRMSVPCAMMSSTAAPSAGSESAVIGWGTGTPPCSETTAPSVKRLMS